MITAMTLIASPPSRLLHGPDECGAMELAMFDQGHSDLSWLAGGVVGGIVALAALALAAFLLYRRTKKHEDEPLAVSSAWP